MKKTFKYDFQSKEFVIKDGRLQPTTDIRVWIEKILRTERGRAIIYEGEEYYGVQLEDLLVGQVLNNKSFIESEAKREIQQALLQNIDIARIENFHIADDEAIVFTVILQDGVAFDQTIEFSKPNKEASA